MSRALVRSGAFEKVTLLTARSNGRTPPEMLDGLCVERLWKNGAPNAGWLIASRLQQISPDLVWFNLGASMFGASPLANLSGMLSPGISRRMGLASVVTLHELLERSDLRRLSAPGGSLAWLGARFLTRAAAQADVLCVTLRLNFDWLASRRPGLRLAHIPIGVYDSLPLPSEESQLEIAGSSPPELLVFTTFAPFKGLELMLEAYGVLRASRPDLRLVVAGARHARFPDYADEFRARIEGLQGVDCRVDVAETELPRLFERATLVVLPYIATTGASSVLYRAAARGRPVVSSSLPELRAQCEESGLSVAFFAPGDGAALRQVIAGLLDDPNARKSLARHNLDAARRAGGIDATLNAYLETFELALRTRYGSGQRPSPEPTGHAP